MTFPSTAPWTGTRSCGSCSSLNTSAPPLDAGDLGWRWLRLPVLRWALLPHTMASSDGLEDDCLLRRGRSQSDPSSITEVRLGEAHRAGKMREEVPTRMLDNCHLVIGVCFCQLIGSDISNDVVACLHIRAVPTDSERASFTNIHVLRCCARCPLYVTVLQWQCS